MSLSANANGTVSGHAGLNWDAAGQEIYYNGCESGIEPPVGAPTMVVTPPVCFGPDAPIATSFTVQVTIPEGAGNVWLSVSTDDWEESPVLVTQSSSVLMPLNGEGTFDVTMTNSQENVVASTAFVLAECETSAQLELALTVGNCTEVGGEPATSGVVSVSGLIVGQTYHVSLTKDGTEIVATDVVAPANELDVPVPLNGVGEYELTISHGENSVSSAAALTACRPGPPVPPGPPKPPVPPVPPQPPVLPVPPQPPASQCFWASPRWRQSHCGAG